MTAVSSLSGILMVGSVLNVRAADFESQLSMAFQNQLQTVSATTSGMQARQAGEHARQAAAASIFVKAPDILDDPSASNEVPGHFQPQGLSLSVRDDVGDGVRQAFSILEEAAQAADSKWETIFRSVRASLGAARSHWPTPGNDFKGCSSHTLAFTRRGSDQIYICAQTLYSGHSSDYIAQVLIHEGAHVDGYYNECSATRVEVNAMRLSGVGLVFRNDYMEQCGID